METKCKLHSDYNTSYFCLKETKWYCELCMKDHKACGYPYHYTEVLDWKKKDTRSDTSMILKQFHKAIDDTTSAIKSTNNGIQEAADLLDHCQQLSTTGINVAEATTLSDAMMLLKYKSFLSGDIFLDISEKIMSNRKKLMGALKRIKNFKDIPKARIGSEASNLLSFADYGILSEWINPNSILLFKRVFVASEHEFLASEFYKCVGKSSPTVVVCKTDKDKIIGGYTPLKWKGNGYIADLKKESFLFSLTLNKKFACKDGTYALSISNSVGPVFGGGHDLQIVDKCNVNFNSYYNLGHSYEASGTTAGEFYGGTQFHIVEYEVFAIKH